ncbi:DNA repair and transcription factor Ada [Blastomyces dermatitidis ATCC 18188]|uniref:DNA repair and transcription factor Ada n=1 Tax=Ajellomyces dermatitidis (strain ATCC 18188 / CBS 674.68) TaxID=653446 RepID=F2TS72_AJEDA|nr:DNA repair and transcription factor Ada [Blastomyces dermatitidis ATCC 18188]EQL31972.1 hypothetical protein BDFG_05770 [Blastomyces dermatitidis ATCC 26199]
MAVSTTSSSIRWRAIVNRDATANDFVYGVRTTKIYCRPRCPARLARRANVEFYDTPKQAEKAGYRPCKRCKPEDLRAPPDPHIKLAQRACQTMTLAALRAASGANTGEARTRPTLQDLANEAGLTPSHFHRVFKKVVGITPGRFAREVMEGKKMTGYLKRLEEGISASGGGYAGYGGGAGTCGAGAGVEKADADGEGRLSVDFSSKPGGAAANGLGLDGVDGVFSPTVTTDSQNYTALPHAGSMRIDWNEFDRMLGGTGGGDARRNSNNNHSNSHQHHSHALPHNHNSGFSIADQKQQQPQSPPQTQAHTQAQTQPNTQAQTSTATTTAPLHPHILDPSSTNTAGLLLDHYELPWESPDCTLNFSSSPTRHVSTAGYSSGSLSPYDYDPLIDTNANTDFYSKFFDHNNTTTTTTLNSNCNINCNTNCSNITCTNTTTTTNKQQQQQQEPFRQLDLSEDSASLTPVDTPPFLVDSLHTTGFSSGASSASSAHASPLLLFEDVDWYGSPSIFQTYA